MVNTIEPSMCVGDATLCQITMTIDHITYRHILCKQIKVNMFQCTNEQRQMIGRDNFWQWVQILNTRTAKKCFLQLTLVKITNECRRVLELHIGVTNLSGDTKTSPRMILYYKSVRNRRSCRRLIPNKAQHSSYGNDSNHDRLLVNRHCTDSSWFISVTDTGNHTLLARIR